MSLIVSLIRFAAMHDLDQTRQRAHVDERAPDFSLPDHYDHLYSLALLLGHRGLLLGFLRDVWLPRSVHRVTWLQTHARQLTSWSIRLALVIANQPNTLHNFYTSSPVPPEFPLLADEALRVHGLYDMTQQAGLVLVDRHRVVRARWLMGDAPLWPPLDKLTSALKEL